MCGKCEKRDTKSIVVFGDSLSDTGNLKNIIGADTFDKTYPQNTNGALTNGTTWAGYLSNELKKCYELGFAKKVCPKPEPKVKHVEVKKSCKLIKTAESCSSSTSCSSSSSSSSTSSDCVSRSSDELDNFLAPNFCNNLVNYAITGAVINPTFDNSTSYLDLSFQVDKFIQDFDHKFSPKDDCKRKCEKKQCLDVIFMIGSNDLFAIIDTYLNEIKEAKSVCTATDLATTPLTTAAITATLDAYVAQWTRVAKYISCKCCKPKQFLVSNVPDLTLTSFFQNLLATFGLTTTGTSPIPFCDPSLTAANTTEAVRLLLQYYSDQLQARIDAWNNAQNCPFIALLDIFEITNSIYSQRAKHGISAPLSQPVWNSQDIPPAFGDFKLNPYYLNNKCAVGAALWDNIHPTKLVQFPISKNVFDLLTLWCKIPNDIDDNCKKGTHLL